MSALLVLGIVPKVGSFVGACCASLTSGGDAVRPGELVANILLHLTFDSLLGLATPSPHIDSNAAELRRYAPQEREDGG